MTARTVEAECLDPHSMLNLYRDLSAGLLPPDATAWLRSAPANSTRQTSHHEAEGGE